jgi:glycosyltransferase involved in cell wall biosynthesis
MMSVVIPSLGGDLSKTLDSLNSGTIKPDEIIICVPNMSHSVKGLSIYKNTVVVYSEKYGQVYQRICGFKKAKNPYVLQLDDDIILAPDCLELLMLTMKNTKVSSAVSPCWFSIKDNTPLHQSKRNGLIMSLYYWIINGNTGYKSGKVSLAGTNFGVNPEEVRERVVSVDWQPGGCILHEKPNLVLDNYYPFNGKAYCEDLVHSFFLRKSGISLIVNTQAVCMTNINPRLDLKKEILSNIKQRMYFVKLANLSIPRMYFYYVTYISKSFLISILHKYI